ncbi:glycosyltransferase [Paenibacillus sp. SYP-B3998]|uniref:Glycosyltransferase n=1 Tax=Paenibacillus sp. SYP-B3998 TaxID=2678564 RepID=A0A6G4A0A2_9BACL|nr:glycosyltransferase [Paenibacillus sp. SYP-B3998]NEW07077.1 glycosyltransferase [Paenibacillus sp. SYP-B3998]
MESFRNKTDSKLKINTQEYQSAIPYEKVMPSRTNSNVSIILIHGGKNEELVRCLDSISKNSTYKNYEIMIIAFAEIREAILEKYKGSIVKVMSFEKSFGLSKSVNKLVATLKSDYIVLLSDNIIIASPNWIEELIYCLNLSEVGVVAPVLLSSESTTERVHKQKKVSANNLLEGLAVTRSCLMMDTNLYRECEGLNEYLINSYANIDLCLRIQEMGKTIIVTPKAHILEMNNKHEEVFDFMDKALFLNRWKEKLESKFYL